MAAAVDRLLDEARAELGPRPGPDDLDRLVAEGALVVDTRPEAVRRAEGALPGAVVIERNVLEWRLGPDGDHRHPDAGDPGRVVVLVCNDGYASSLAAVALRRLGVPRATDLDGGYRAWAARRPVHAASTDRTRPGP
ncbi:rhodanese-like domain-containing protein [Iamia sp. SCSIO 61187]|uniref:rhodanese-like domain-containing protein n=1 Tax=Iamia sp. SCSIO 61187 TaxID=2722752 RepID=UPI001C634367|nr:rhodanese-like domain-containing protein [Iamia sp. SCSIO 61187]QYG92127.1 rhodanese-like domain-containing protein [Iamia sp. SCSIO 61187]